MRCRRRALLLGLAAAALLATLCAHPGWRLEPPSAGPAASLVQTSDEAWPRGCDDASGCCRSAGSCLEACLLRDPEGRNESECAWRCMTWSGSVSRFPDGMPQRYLNDTHRHCFRGIASNPWPPPRGGRRGDTPGAWHTAQLFFFPWHLPDADDDAAPRPRPPVVIPPLPGSSSSQDGDDDDLPLVGFGPRSRARAKDPELVTRAKPDK